MSEPEDDASFLSRWSRRKTAARVDTPAAPETGGAENSGDSAALVSQEGRVDPATQPAPVPLPDIETLTPEGDFSPFMARGVDAGTRNMAMKKLFTDPHYGFDNMDKLDIYLDDYSKPDPIPLEMLRGLNQAKRMFLFDDDETVHSAAASGQTGDTVPAVAASPGKSDGTEAAIDGEIESDSPPATVIAESAQPK